MFHVEHSNLYNQNLQYKESDKSENASHLKPLNLKPAKHFKL